MKKNLSLFLLLLCVMLTGCQAGKVNIVSYDAAVTNAPAAAQSAASAAAETEAAAPVPVDAAVQETPATETEAHAPVPVDVSVQQANGPTIKHLSAVVRSNTGKTTVTFDADVPSGAESPWLTYRCQPRLFTETEIVGMADACFGAVQYTGGNGFTYAHHEIDKNNPYANDTWTMRAKSTAMVTGRGGQRIASAEMPVDMQRLPDGTIIEAYAEYRKAQEPGKNYFWTLRTPQPLSVGTVEGITPEEAEQLSVEAVSSFAPDFSIAARALTMGELLQEQVGDRLLKGSWGYFFVFTRCINGHNLNYANSNLNNDDYFSPRQTEEIIVIVDKEGIQGMKYQGPHEVMYELETVALLPFEQISEVAFEVLPLKYASYEKDQDAVNLYVNEIQLGYMRVMSRNQPEFFELIPVWDFYGYEAYERGGEQNVYEDAYTSLLTINAIDGTIIDRDYGY